jgi:N6-L-threonylcarbamoyladenine synthase
MVVLGIESSCDETAVGIVEDGSILHSNAVLSSMDLHASFGGVVPEVAAREHIKSIQPVIDMAFSQSGMNWSDIDAIAVTKGAGLGGSLLVGVMTARTLSILKNKPLYGVNHVEGHVYANFLVSSRLGYILPYSQPVFPILALIVSGGHTQLAIFRDHFDYTLLGQTQDDAIGEAYDKVAKILGLPYPGGPSVGGLASSGDSAAFSLPKSKMSNKYDFSFSGLKTAVLRHAQSCIGKDFTFPSHLIADSLSEVDKSNIAAVFNRVAVETVVDKTLIAYEEYRPKSVVIAGGVAASPELRLQLSRRLPIEVQYTDPRLCTDNGAMIATLGCYKALRRALTDDPYSLEIDPSLSM